jgi:trimeric autotransporter adhesin
MKTIFRYSLLCVVFTFFSVCLFAQTRSGNYLNRDDSTNVLHPFQYNTILGPSAGRNITNVEPSVFSFTSNSTLIGSSAGYSLGKLTFNGSKSYSPSVTMIGAFAGYGKIAGYTPGGNIGIGDTYIGAFSGYLGKNTGGNTFVGYKSGYDVDSTNEVVAIGISAGEKIRNASGSIFIGNRAGQNSSGTYNTVIGINSASNIQSDDNFILASYTPGSNPILKTGNNIFIGKDAGNNSNGGFSVPSGSQNGKTWGDNIFIGGFAGSNTNSSRNVFIGQATALFNTLGTQNTFIGWHSGIKNSTANYNVFLGVDAGKEIQTGGANTFIGTDAGVDATFSSIQNSVAIGYGSRVTANNSFILGDSQTKVGIGNTAPNNKLEITSATTNTSGLRFTNLKSTSTPSTANSLALSVDANGDVILVPAATGGLTNPVTNLQVLSGTAGVSGLRLNNLPNTSTAVTANGKALSVDATGNVILVPVTTPVIPAGADVWDQLTNGADYLIRNKNNKSVMIGTVAAAKTSIDYKLYVEKGILAEKVKVSAQANWPDYVFGKDYSLMPLKEVENYITTNNHLPEVPSADVIAKDGLDLGKMDATLLKKVEELTLYLIEQSKKIEVLQNELNTLKAKK